MSIYLFTANTEDYLWIFPKNEQDWDIINEINPTNSKWIKTEMEFMDPEENDEINELSDFPNLIPSIPVFSNDALNILGSLIENDVNVLDIEVDSYEKYFLLNVIRIVDCLDVDKSELIRFESSGRIMDIEKFVFKSEKLQNKNIFKIPDYNSAIFVSEEFVQVVEKSNLKGYVFEKIDVI